MENKENNPMEIDNKYEASVFIVKEIFKNFWKSFLVFAVSAGLITIFILNDGLKIIMKVLGIIK
jgi:hypothetical protein